MGGQKDKVELPRSCVAMVMVLLLWLLVISPARACPQSVGGGGCKSCMVNQMKYGCPSCVPSIRCMARCLWGGTPKAKCVKTCDCGKPRLSDCNRCLSPCRCSCIASA